MWTRERPEVTAMARTTAKQVLDRVDALLPNGYARAEKLRWLAQAEGFVRRELCRETGELPVLTEETELTADQYEARVAGVTERFPFLVARDDAGNVAGFAYLSDFNPRSGYRHTADLSIYTAPDLRGVGLGAALLAAIEAEGRKMGITNLISIITDENAASCRFHEKNGFVKEGHLHDIAVKFGRRCGACYYRKELG